MVCSGKTMLMVMILMAQAVLLQGQANVTLELKGFHSNEGDLLLAVFNDPDQFPYDPSFEFKWPKDTMSGEVMVVSFTLPGPGEYALSVLDDENSSGDLDKNFIGFPTEHFGFSNDARPGFFKPPDYEDCVVDIRKGDNLLTITIKKY